MPYPFEYRKPTNEEAEIIADIGKRCQALHAALVTRIPICRESSLALTKLDECFVWAIQAAVVGEVGPAESSHAVADATTIGFKSENRLQAIAKVGD